MAGRISCFWDFKGPSLAVDSDRSSSLTALHLALSALRAGEIEIAVVGGVNLILGPESGAGLGASMVLSPDGACRFGDANANGIARGEGIVFVVLRKQEAAAREGDRIYAGIASSTVNHNGTGGGDIVVPSQAAQESLVRDACEAARISPAEVSYIEAHGTGTPVGDAIELSALAKAIGSQKQGSEPLLVGSVKTNLGHTEAAAGLAGLVKVALSLRHRLLPASLHFSKPNPKIGFGESNLKIPTKAVQLGATPGQPVYAGVSSLGLTGANAFVLLESSPGLEDARPPVPRGPRAEILLFSSHTEDSLRKGLADLALRLGDGASPSSCGTWPIRRPSGRSTPGIGWRSRPTRSRR